MEQYYVYWTSYHYDAYIDFMNLFYPTFLIYLMNNINYLYCNFIYFILLDT